MPQAEQAFDDMAVAVDQLLEAGVRLAERLDGVGMLGIAGFGVMDHGVAPGALAGRGLSAPSRYSLEDGGG